MEIGKSTFGVTDVVSLSVGILHCDLISIGAYLHYRHSIYAVDVR